MRFIRNYLERANAEPLIFRLKYLDDRSEALSVLLRAEIRARQFFLLCESRHSRASHYVREELKYVDKLPDKIKCKIDLDDNPWVTPKSAIDALLRHASIVITYGYKDRARVSEWVRLLTLAGVDPPRNSDHEDRIGDGAIAAQVYKPESAGLQEPATIDHGVIALDDQGLGDPNWLQAAIGAATRASTIVLCVTRSDFEAMFQTRATPDNPRSPSELAVCPSQASTVRNAYRYAYALDPDHAIQDREAAILLEATGWTVLSGSIQDQLARLVFELRKQDPEYIEVPKRSRDNMRHRKPD